MRRLVFVLACLLLAVPLSAQTPITDYRVRYYAPGATQPLQQDDPFPASAAQCNQAPPTGTNTVNPTRVVWDDPAVAGRVCIYTPAAGGALVSFPLGAYEGTLTAINSVGASGESARAPFSRAAAATAPSGLRFIR